LGILTAPRLRGVRARLAACLFSAQLATTVGLGMFLEKRRRVLSNFLLVKNRPWCSSQRGLINK
jgi:hypothetical protein